MRIWIFALLSQLTFAFNLIPLSQTILVGKDNSTVIFQVENKTKEPIALEASLRMRLMDESGKEQRPEIADGKFLIYPEQIVLKPGQKRGIKVKWLGAKVSNEQSFRIIVEQLPIDFKKQKKTGVKLLLKYVGALYVSQRDFESKISLKGVVRKGENLIFPIVNNGKQHKVLNNLKIAFRKKGQKEFFINDKALAGISGENILSNSKRVFKIKTPSELKTIDLSSGRFILTYE